MYKFQQQVKGAKVGLETTPITVIGFPIRTRKMQPEFLHQEIVWWH